MLFDVAMRHDAPHLRWVDSWRGFLILVVVFWHALGGGMTVSGTPGTMATALYESLGRFHMLAFFAVSGFVWSRRPERFLPYAKKHFLHLMVPYYAFAALSLAIVGLQTVIMGPSSMPGCSFVDDIRTIALAGRPVCYSPLWFLGCLFAIMLAYYWIDRVSRRAFAVFGLTMMIAYLSRYGYDILCVVPVCSFIVLPRYLIAFSLGHLLGRYLRREFAVGRREKWRLFALGTVALFAVTRWNIVAVPLPWSCLIPVLTLVVIVATLCLAVAMDNRYLAWIGQGWMTLGILCLHKFPILFLQRLPVVRQVYRSEGGAFAATACITVVAVALSVGGTLFVRRHLPWMFGEKSARGSGKKGVGR